MTIMNYYLEKSVNFLGIPPAPKKQGRYKHEIPNILEIKTILFGLPGSFASCFVAQGMTRDSEYFACVVRCRDFSSGEL